MSIKVFHGSNMSVYDPVSNYSKARDNIDFGKGFYVTSYEEQAKNWAMHKAETERNGAPTVTVYQLDDSLLHSSFNVYEFTDGYTEEWLDFIVSCRLDGRLYGNDDCIYGPVADDTLAKNIERYMRCDISKEEFLKALAFSELNDQYCFTNNRVIRSCLQYETDYEI